MNRTTQYDGQANVKHWSNPLRGGLTKASLLVLLIASLASGQVKDGTYTPIRHNGQQKSTKQQEALAKLRQRVGGEVQLQLRPMTGTPRQMKGGVLQAAIRNLNVGEDREVKTASTFLRLNKDVLGIVDPGAELTLAKKHRDALGRTHLRYTQSFHGISVWPASLNVHLDAAGNVDLMEGAFVRTPVDVSTDPPLDKTTALQRALKALPDGASDKGNASTLIIHAPGGDTQARLAWRFDFQGSLESHWLVVIDAQNGATLSAFNQVCSIGVPGSGQDLSGVTRPLNLWEDQGLYYMVDASKPMFDPTIDPLSTSTRGSIRIWDARNQTPDANGNIDLFYVTSSDPDVWDVPDAVSAAHWLSETYDYYLNRHGRDSLDGNGGRIIAIVRYKRDYFNAFWNGQLLVFGDAAPFAGTVDVIAHESTHAVTQNTSNLIYLSQSGALNEAISDIFGELVEAESTGQNDWLVGAGLGQPLRDMADPNRLGDPAKMSEFVNTNEDNGGVHTNSGIINHCFYLLAEGMAGAIGLDSAGQIFYRANTVHLVENSQFIDARLGCVQSAEELFGTNSIEAEQTRQAFDAVEIFADTSPPVQDDIFEENDSQQTAKLIQAGTRQLQGADEDWFRFSVSQPSRVQIVIDGSEGDLDLFVLDSQGNILGSSTSGTSSEDLDGNESGAVTRFVLVSPYQNQGSSYELSLQITPVDPPCSSDRDGDGVCDSDDNCPDTFNPSQADSDGDGVGDSCHQTCQPDLCGQCTPMSLFAMAAGMIGFGSAVRRRFGSSLGGIALRRRRRRY